MFRENRGRRKPIYKGRQVMVPGVRDAAKEFGRSIGHLHGVVTGQRKSGALLARYLGWARERGLRVPGHTA